MAITQKATYDIFLIFTKYSTHFSLSANTGFKSLAFILCEILHLQCLKHQKRAITKKIWKDLFLSKFHQILLSSSPFSSHKFQDFIFNTFRDIAVTKFNFDFFKGQLLYKG